MNQEQSMSDTKAAKSRTIQLCVRFDEHDVELLKTLCREEKQGRRDAIQSLAFRLEASLLSESDGLSDRLRKLESLQSAGRCPDCDRSVEQRRALEKGCDKRDAVIATLTAKVAELEAALKESREECAKLDRGCDAVHQHASERDEVLESQEEQIEAELDAQDAEIVRLNKGTDLNVQSLVDWWHSIERPDPALAFSSGLYRQIADLMILAGHNHSHSPDTVEESQDRHKSSDASVAGESDAPGEGEVDPHRVHSTDQLTLSANTVTSHQPRYRRVPEGVPADYVPRAGDFVRRAVDATCSWSDTPIGFVAPVSNIIYDGQLTFAGIPGSRMPKFFDLIRPAGSEVQP